MLSIKNSRQPQLDNTLLGSYLDDIIQNDPVSMKRVSKGLDEFLERDRDRALFDLLPRPKEVS